MKQQTKKPAGDRAGPFRSCRHFDRSGVSRVVACPERSRRGEIFQRQRSGSGFAGERFLRSAPDESGATVEMTDKGLASVDAEFQIDSRPVRIGPDGRTPSGSTLRFRRAMRPTILPGGAAPGVDPRARSAKGLEIFLQQVLLRTPERRLSNDSNELRLPSAKKRKLSNNHSNSRRFPASNPSGTPFFAEVSPGEGDSPGQTGYMGNSPDRIHG